MQSGNDPGDNASPLHNSTIVHEADKSSGIPIVNEVPCPLSGCSECLSGEVSSTKQEKDINSLLNSSEHQRQMGGPDWLQRGGQHITAQHCIEPTNDLSYPPTRAGRPFCYC